MNHLSQSINPRQRAWVAVVAALLALVAVGALLFPTTQSARAAAGLSVRIIAAPNLIVDSNVLSPSTYQPIVATVIGEFCNTGTTGDPDLTNVVGRIGNYINGSSDTPGTYPVQNTITISGGGVSTTYRGPISFTHLGGTADATRLVGTIPAGECRYQYWSFTYPKTAINDATGATIPGWGTSVKPGDDLWLEFDIWGTADGSLADNATHKMTLRNEISAMANKIKPNPDGRWFNTDTDVVYPGDTVTTNGILYRIGNVGFGFDNDGDGLPDYNAWLQPFGDPSYDPSCFRLVHTSGVLTVTRSSGMPDMIINFEDNLYFTNLPTNNTNVDGKVYYTFLALGGACTVPISPYQEAASGYDNEKFNGDYGTGLPALRSYEPEVIINKTGDTGVAEPGTITYEIPFYNNSADATAGLTLSSGGLVDMPLMIQDTIPGGLQYVCGSANVIDRTPADLGFVVQYSKDSGATWGTETATWAGCGTSGTYVSPDSGKSIMLRFVLTEPLPKKTGTPAPGGTATFQARVPANFVSGGGTPFIENCAEARFGYDTPPFTEACAVTMVEGTGSIGDRVWLDENANGLQDTGELGIENIKVSLYWDRNGNGFLDENDLLVLPELETSGTGTSNYDYTKLPAANYIVKVDTTDPQLTGNTTLTTVGFYAVSLAAGQDYNAADFGFAPSLRLDKYLETYSPAVVGETVTFRIDLRNTLPGDGTSNGYCTYYVWPSVAATDSVAGKQFANPDYAMGTPNFLYATADFTGGSNRWISGSTFSSGGRTSGITQVEAIFDIYLTERLVDDYLTISMSGGAAAWSHSYTTSEMNGYAAGEGAKGYLTYVIPGANAPVGAAAGWDWADFNVSALTLRADVDKGSKGESSYLYLDAMGFRVTTNDTSCANGNTTINPLPLDDTFDTTYLQFLSAEPPPSSTGAGTLHWDNLGPLYAGGLRTVLVHFKALATTTGTDNTASVTEAQFANGNDTNDDDDKASVVINASGSIAGRVFADSGTPGTWVAGTGYGTGDTFFPGTTVQLWGCYSTVTDRIITAATAGDTNKTCTNAANQGEWRMITTAITAVDGSYSFTGLRDGYYNVIVDTTTLPPGFVSSVETTAAGNGAGGGAGDSLWNTTGANLDTFNDILNGSTGENITVVSFGYRDDTASPNTDGGLYGYVWNDKDGDGVWDTGEEPIPGVSVYVCASTVTPPCNSGNATATATTDNQGRFIFGNLDPGSYYTQVDTSDLPGMSQSGDPDESGTCSVCDSRNTNYVTVTANVIADAGDFGYTGGLSIGDTIYVDWNGDGDKDGSAEEGIPNVTVYLYRDLDGDGVVDPGDTLLATDVTDASGIYGFSGLAGNGNKYLVVVDSNTIPPGYLQTADPDATKDHKNVVTLNDTSVDTVDFGYQPRGFGSVGDFVWYDTDGDGIQDSSEAGVPYVTLNIYEDHDGDGVIDAEDAFIASTNTLNYNVFDGGIDINGNGSIDSGDDLTTGGGLYGYLVYDGRLDINGDGSVNTADDGNLGPYVVIDGYLDFNASGGITGTDDGSLKGFYLFKNLPLFNNLPADDFIIQVAPAEFSSGGDLVGYALTNTGTPYDATQVSYELALAANQVFYEVDFGFAKTAVGDFVWVDANGNGMHDTGEVGLNGVTVNLYVDANNNGVLDPAESATPYRTTTTANSNGNPGYYLFDGIPVGNYVVEVVPPSGYGVSGDPDAYNPTNPLDLSCLNADGTADGNMVGCDGRKYLDRWDAADDNDLSPALAAGQRDLSADFGLRPSGSILGDFVWLDINGDGVQDAGETGIAGATVTLVDCGADLDCSTPGDNGAPVVTTTNPDGYYSFSGLAQRKYQVTVSGLPLGLAPTYDYDGTSTANVAEYTFTAVGSFLGMDFGYRYNGNNNISGNVFFDTGTLGGAYDDVAPGVDNPIANVPVYLYDGATLVGITYTDASGYYAFTNLPNSTFTVVVGSNSPQLANLSRTYEPDEGDGNCTNAGSACNGRVTITLTGNQTVTDQDFGFYAYMDCGDLPESYNASGFDTKLGNEGPCHVNVNASPALPTRYLGARWDGETDGQPSTTAIGDDQAGGTNDEDGVVRNPADLWTNGKTVRLNVTVVGTNAYLAAWFDWNNDGNFVGTTVSTVDGRTESQREYVYFGLLAPGTHTLSVVIPPVTDPLDPTYTGACCNSRSLMVRFRLYEGNSPPPVIAPSGTVLNGEVEDYQWNFGPTAVEMISLEANVNPSGLPAWAWITAAAVVGAGGLVTLRAWRKRR